MATSMVRCVDASAHFSEVVGSSDSLSVFLQSFVIDKKIGKGQFSEVFRARSNETGNAVALKKIKVHVGLDCMLRCSFFPHPFASLFI